MSPRPKTARRGAPLRGGAPPAGRRLRLDLAFDGTGLRGWQSQVKGTTVQDLLDQALRAIGHAGGRAVGCSRTDAGVHARAFTAHVDAPPSRPADAILKGLNANLPAAVRVYRVSPAGEDFHARYGCAGKTYRYHLFTGPVVPPFMAPFVWAWRGTLDLPAMARACAHFEGEHDFSAFTTEEGRRKRTARTLTRCRVEARSPLVVLEVSGPSFLHRMVRLIGGAVVAAGTGRLDPAVIGAVLGGAPPPLQIPALPAQGLVLWEVLYPGVPPEGDTAGEIPPGALLFPF